jgi:hypothetical protein
MGIGTSRIVILLEVALQYNKYLFLFLPLAMLSALFLFQSKSCAIMNIGKYMRVLEEEFIKADRSLGWKRWLYNSPDKCKAYVKYNMASIGVLVVLYLFCIAGIFYFLLPSQGNWGSWVLGNNSTGMGVSALAEKGSENGGETDALA